MGEVIITDRVSFTNQQINTIVPKETYDPSYIYYSFRLRKMELLSLGSAAGARTPILNKSAFCNLKMRAPSLPTQRRVSSILGAYDDLIEVNQHRMAVLQAIVLRLFNEWFVHLQGLRQGESAYSPGKKALRAWPKRALGEVIEFEKGRKPITVFDRPTDHTVPQLLVDVLRGGDPKFIKPDRMVIVRPDDTIMVMDGSGSAEVFIGHTGAIGSTLGRYRCRPGAGVTPYWLFLLLHSKADELKSKNTGAAVPHANKDYISRIEFNEPPVELSQHFHRIVNPKFEMVATLAATNARLAASRDLLLPHLMSGNLSVSTAERDLETAA
jgi:type I restriction enzyme S subunit